MSNAYNEQAADLINGTMDLIERILIKHSAAVLEEMRDQIVSRNDLIKQLEADCADHRLAAHEADMRTQAAVRGEKAAIAERDALLGDKDEYCEVLRVLGMEEEGSAVIEILRLVAVEQEYLHLVATGSIR